MKASEEWKIKEKVATVVRDNAANMVLALERLEDWNAELDLDLISRLTDTCRKIVGHF